MQLTTYKPVGPTLVVAAGFLIDYDPERSCTHQHARLEVTPEGDLNVFCLDGHDLFVATVKGATGEGDAWDFYLEKATLASCTKETVLEFLEDFEVNVQDYRLQGVAKVLATAPGTPQVRVRKSEFMSATTAMRSALAKSKETAVVRLRAARPGTLEIDGVTLDGQVLLNRHIPAEILAVDAASGLEARFEPETLSRIAQSLDGIYVELWADRENTWRPMSFKGETRRVLSMPLPKN